MPLTIFKNHPKFVKIPLRIQFFLNFQNMFFVQLITNDSIPIPTFKFDSFKDNEKKKDSSFEKNGGKINHVL